MLGILYKTTDYRNRGKIHLINGTEMRPELIDPARLLTFHNLTYL
jgi:hypothetical protein